MPNRPEALMYKTNYIYQDKVYVHAFAEGSATSLCGKANRGSGKYAPAKDPLPHKAAMCPYCAKHSQTLKQLFETASIAEPKGKHYRRRYFSPSKFSHRLHQGKTSKQISAMLTALAEDYLTCDETVTSVSRRYKVSMTSASRAIQDYCRDKNPTAFEQASKNGFITCENLRDYADKFLPSSDDLAKTIDAIQLEPEEKPLDDETLRIIELKYRITLLEDELIRRNQQRRPGLFRRILAFLKGK